MIKHILLILFFIGPLWAQFDQLALESVSSLTGVAPEALTVMNQRDAIFPTLDRSATVVKVLDPEGRMHRVAFDPQGYELDLEALGEQEQEAHRAIYGQLDPQLYEHLLQVPGDEPVDIAIWIEDNNEPLELPEVPFEERSETLAEQILFELAEYREQQVWEMVQPMLSTLQAYDAEPVAMRYAPLIQARVRADLVWVIANLGGIDRIYPQTYYYPTMAHARKSLWVDHINGRNATGSLWGNTGAGVKVGIMEAGHRNPSTHCYLKPYTIDTAGFCPYNSDHATHVMGIVASTHPTHLGIAPDAQIRLGGHCTRKMVNGTHRHAATDKGIQQATDRAINWGATVCNYSLGADNNGHYSSDARYYDNLTRNLWRTFVIAAGNDGHDATHYIDSPGLAYNVITVGAYDERDTRSRADDIMYASSSFRNPRTKFGDCQKPDLVAPGVDITSTTLSSTHLGDMTGTSMATPMVTGTVALMQKANYWLRLQPEATKAILMATAINNIEGDRARSDKDGAGGMDTESAVEMARDHEFPFRAHSWHSSDHACYANKPPIRYSQHLEGGKEARIAIAWSADNHNGSPSLDFDIVVGDENDRYVAGTASFDGTTEALVFTPPQDGDYRILITASTCDQYRGTIRLGYACFQF